MSNSPAPSDLGAPAHRVIITLTAYDLEQAKRFAAQARAMFADAKTTIEDCTLGVSSPTAPSAPESQPESATDIRSAELLRAAAENPQSVPELAPPGAPESQPAERPFALGDFLRDLHVERDPVEIVATDEAGFFMADGNFCPWASAACYEKVSKRRAVLRAGSGATAEKKPRARKPAAPKDRATLNPAKVRQPRARTAAPKKKPTR